MLHKPNGIPSTWLNSHVARRLGQVSRVADDSSPLALFQAQTQQGPPQVPEGSSTCPLEIPAQVTGEFSLHSIPKYKITKSEVGFFCS